MKILGEEEVVDSRLEAELCKSDLQIAESSLAATDARFLATFRYVARCSES